MVDKTDLMTDQTKGAELIPLFGSTDLIGTNNPIDILKYEGGEGFYKYADWFGLAKDPNMVVLSSRHHYFYDADDMKNVKTVINLKELNQVKGIKSLLHSCLHILPQIRNFIGCFVDNDMINGYVLKENSPSDNNRKSFDATENSIVSRFPFINMLYSIMDSKTNTYMSMRSVTLLLENYGFKIIDMTVHNGRTYFYSQKIGDTYN